MRILVVSPLGYAVHSGLRYAGIERLAEAYSSALSARHQVTVMGRPDSKYHPDVATLTYLPEEGQDIYRDAELAMYQRFQSTLKLFDVIHDFSHQHFASRYNKLPSLNNIWHAPAVANYSKSPYNIICPSQWAVGEFRRHYRQDARFMPTIVLDTSIYKPGTKKRNDRMLSLGMITPRKGHLEAAKLCIEAGVPLDIAGRKGGEAPDYEAAIDEICEHPLVDYLGEVSDEEKVELLQTNKAMVFYNNEEEVTSHKLQEAMLCGQMVLAPAIGALPEIITDGVNGVLCHDRVEYLKAIKNTPPFQMDSYEALRKTYDIDEVVSQWEPLYEQVAGGLRWQ